MIKKHVVFLFFICFLSLSGCVPSRDDVGTNSAISVPTATAPLGKNEEDVPLDGEGIKWVRSMIEAHPNGLAISVNSSYKNTYADLFSTYFVDFRDTFTAKILVGNSSPERREIAVVCLLNHVQVPCTPDSPKEYIVTVPGQELRFLPLRLENLESGLHDLDLLAVRDPYKDGVNEVGDSIRYSTLAHMDTNNILVEGLTSPPAQLVSLKPMVAGELERESIFDASPNRKLTNELGNIPLWIEGEGKPGGTLPFYLHFNSGVHDEEGDVIAVSAFLNYEQIPLYHEAEAYLPLYIERQAGTWQVLPVNIRLPETPGTYELVITARTDVFSLLELERSDRDVFGTEESNRIKITVHP